MRRSKLRAVLHKGLPLLLPAWLAMPALVRAEPLDLADVRPRAIQVRFEVSPADLPGQTRSRFTPMLPARIEPGERGGEMRVRIAGHTVETHLLAHERPRPGSFSDFVWVFDSRSGHVRSATLSGVFERRVRLGPMSFLADTRVEVRMNTLTAVGFASGQVLGEPYPRLCTRPEGGRCQLVEPRRYDPSTGYVNAVGEVAASHKGLRIRSFSPLGEALFSELPLAEPDAPLLRAEAAQVGPASATR